MGTPCPGRSGLRDNLVDCRTGEDVLGFGLLGVDARQPAGGSNRVIPDGRARAREVPDDDQLILIVMRAT